MFTKDGQDLPLLLLLRLRGDGKVPKGNIKEVGPPFRSLMIGDNYRNIDRQLPSPVSLQHIDQTMVVLRHQNADSGLPVRKIYLKIHIKNFGDRSEGIGNLFLRNLKSGQIKQGPHKKVSRFPVRMVIGIQNVSSKFMDEPCYPRNKAFLVFAENQ